MSPKYSSPAALVRALQNRQDGARTQFQQWMRDPITRLMKRLQEEHHLDYDLDRLTKYALHAAETYLRSFKASQLQDLSESAFRTMLLLYLARFVSQPYGKELQAGVLPEELPKSSAYTFLADFRPYEKIGSFWYGGDWFGAKETDDGSLWLIVADITGHGYCAYLLANTLPGLWKECWSNGSPKEKPHDLLLTMHQLVESCLPEGVYVETALLRLTPEGDVTIAPAGGIRLLIRNRRENKLELIKLRGIWLGLDAPLLEDEHYCRLENGDELLVGSDGLFDQIIEHLGGSSELTTVIDRMNDSQNLLETMQMALEEALTTQPQQDDITVVLIQRH